MLKSLKSSDVLLSFTPALTEFLWGARVALFFLNRHLGDELGVAGGPSSSNSGEWSAGGSANGRLESRSERRKVASLSMSTRSQDALSEALSGMKLLDWALSYKGGHNLNVKLGIT